MIDLCAGIGGIRKGFEMTGKFVNVLSAEIDKYACATYEHLYGENPLNDITTKEFKDSLQEVEYDVLLAGFPCQSFSRAGLKQGLCAVDKGGIFYDIAEILEQTRPKAFLLENVDNLLSIDRGKTMQEILNLLVLDLNYHVVGTELIDGKVHYTKESFLRNTRDFGLPQNRPRVYIMGFNKEVYKNVNLIENMIPTKSDSIIYKDLEEVLEKNVAPKFFLSEGYVETLEKHKSRHSSKGNGFGYMIVNQRETRPYYSNALLATGGSGKERNLIVDNTNQYAGQMIGSKKTPINNRNIRTMTPTEWGKLQGFINYAFIDQNGVDQFSFPEKMSDTQKFKQFGNSVSIPVIEQMAYFMLKQFQRME